LNEAKWYVAHTYSGYERNVSSAIIKAADNRKMRDLILEIMIPTEDVTEITEENKKKTVTRLIYPGYVFIKMVATDPRAWHLVRNIRGVTGFVGEANKPVPLTDMEIETLGVERKGVPMATRYEVGDIVSIVEGPLDGFNGKISEINAETGAVMVAVSMFGRDTEVELELDQIWKE
jgi:transcriptional antiterminator NusG